MFLRLLDEAAASGTTIAPAANAASVGSGTSGASTPATPAADPGASSGGRATSGAATAVTGAPTPAQTDSGVPTLNAGGAPAQSVAPDLFDRVRTFGGPDLRGKYTTEEDLVKGLANAARLAGQRDQYADIGRQIMPVYSDFQAFMQQRQQGQQAAAPQALQQQPQTQSDPYWDYPQWDESWQNHRIAGEDGKPTWAPDTPVEVQEGFRKWAAWNRRFQLGLSTQPDKVLDPYIERKFNELAEKRFGQYDTTQQARQIGEQTRNWMYQRDQAGQVVVDPITQQPQLHPSYPYYHQALNEVLATGLADPVRADLLAKDIAAGRMAAAGMLPPGMSPQVQQHQQPQIPGSVPTPPGAMHMPTVSAGAGATGTGQRGQTPEFQGDLAQRIMQHYRYNAGAA